MAHAHAQAYQRMRGVKISCCCDVMKKKAKAFARQYEIPGCYTDYQKMLADEELDGVSVVASDAAHAPVSIAAMRRGIAVLCEKPLAQTLQQAQRMVREAEKAKVINMINFTYRESSALTRARELVQGGKLGELRHIEASYLQTWLSSKYWGDWKKNSAWLWRMSKKTGGGTLEDIGCHILDFATFVAGDIARINCELTTFDKGVNNNICAGYKLDANDSAVMTVRFANGATGAITTTRWAAGRLNSVALKVYGTKGGLEIDLDKSWTSMDVCLGKDVNLCRWKKLSCGKRDSIYRRFVRSIRTQKPEAPNFADGARIQEYMEKCHVAHKANR
jgi:predicted dehydrogenase